VIDGHNDLPWAMRRLCDYDFDAVNLGAHAPALQTDMPRLRAGGVTGQFWSVYVPSTLPGPEAVSTTLEQIDFVRRMTERFPDDLALAVTVDQIESARKAGRVASMIGIEGGHSINESLPVLRAMYDLGARYMTLTHNDNVPWADSATDDPVIGGLSAFGKSVVREMNRLGMMVDLSHVSAATMRDALSVATSPVMFSHSSARAVCDVVRNVPDDVLALLPGNGGICMVTFVSDFVAPSVARWFEQTREIVAERGGDPRNFAEVGDALRARLVTDPPPVATIDDVVAHFEHIREVSGIECVGVGSDFDGSMFMPVDLQDVAGFPRLFDALVERRWSDSDLDLVRSGNILRVMRHNEHPIG
jgi:membrane dipeptidase